jgi:hypothetical protein
MCVEREGEGRSCEQRENIVCGAGRGERDQTKHTFKNYFTTKNIYIIASAKDHWIMPVSVCSRAAPVAHACMLVGVNWHLLHCNEVNIHALAAVKKGAKQLCKNALVCTCTKRLVIVSCPWHPGCTVSSLCSAWFGEVVLHTSVQCKTHITLPTERNGYVRKKECVGSRSTHTRSDTYR